MIKHINTTSKGATKMIKTKEELIEKLNGAVVHCPTEELAVKVLAIAHGLGMKWSSGASYISETNWELYLSKTCYSLEGGGYCSKKFYERNSVPIITAETFLSWFEEESKMKITENEGDYTIDIVKRVNVIPEPKPLTTYIERAEANANLIRERLGKASEDLELEDVCSFDKGTFKINKPLLSISEARRLGEWLVKATKEEK